MPAVLPGLVRALLLVLALCAAALGTVSATAAPTGDRPVTLRLTGELETVVGDDFATGRSTEVTSVLVDGVGIPLSAGALGSLPRHGRFEGVVRVPGSVRVQLARAGTVLVDGAVVSADSRAGTQLVRRLADRGRRVPVVAGSVTPLAVAAATPAPHQAYVAIMNNAGDFGATTAELGSLVDQVAAYWVDESDGVISSFARIETEEFASDQADEACGLAGSYDAVWDEADDLFPGVDFAAQPNHLIVLIPADCQSGGGAAGWGRVGGSLADGGKVLAVAETYGRPVIGHELGHNVGLGHANGLEDGELAPYADWYSVMGSAIGGDWDLPVLGSAQRLHLGLLAPGEEALLELAEDASSTSVSYQLAPRGDETGLRTIRVVDPTTLTQYFLDYRSASGPEADTFYADGVWSGKRLGPGLTVVEPVLNDNSSVLHRRSVSGIERYTVQAGETFVSSTGSVSVAVGTATAGRLPVTVSLSSNLPAFTDPPVPVLTGTPEVGGSLYADVGEWPDGTSHEVRWYVDGVLLMNNDFGDPYISQYLGLYEQESGATIYARVRSFDGMHRPLTQVTAPVGPVTGGPLPPGNPTVSGSPRLGALLTASSGTWPAGTELDYQWLRNGSPIGGAAATTYRLVVADVGKRLQVQVTGTKDGFSSSSATSSQTGVVAPGTLTAPTPTITGKAKVGKTLTAVTGTWPAGTTLRYQWLLSGGAVPGATGKTWKLPASAKGKRASVRVTGAKPGYATAAKTSAQTGTVKKP